MIFFGGRRRFRRKRETMGLGPVLQAGHINNKAIKSPSPKGAFTLPEKRDYYEVLGVSKSASEGKAKKHTANWQKNTIRI